MNNAASSKSRLHVDEMHHNVTKDFTKLVNMLCHTALLPDGCVPFEVGEKVANWKWEPTGHFTAVDEVHVTRVRKLLDKNRWWTRAKLSGETGTASHTIHKILTQNLKLQNIYAQRLPHGLTEVYMWQYTDTARLHLSHYEHERGSFLYQILTINGVPGGGVVQTPTPEILKISVESSIA